MISCLLFAFADDTSDVIVSLQINNPTMMVNGEEKEIDKGKGTSPIIMNGRTLVPIRAIIEAFGGDVEWDEDTRSVFLNMEDDAIKLVIDSNEAYLNDNMEILDTAPVIINNRTLLPIRFIAESFNLSVAWNGKTQTVTIIRNEFDEADYNALVRVLPVYSGQAYAEINNNMPFFKSYEVIDGSFEYYSELDELGRCNVCFTSLAMDLMPTEARESISSVTPSGWLNASYENVDGGYLYNRCHLIGFQLAGENANERNLITGTRYLNVIGMLPFENMIADYIKETGNRVVYRSTPVFSGDNLVADGVLLEAYSVEDEGAGITFCVYCYNVQPGIQIDYKTGSSSFVGETTQENVTDIPSDSDVNSEQVVIIVYKTPSGTKYHVDPECGGKNSIPVEIKTAQQSGLTSCHKCA